jgi:hypothetical protein
VFTSQYTYQQRRVCKPNSVRATATSSATDHACSLHVEHMQMQTATAYFPTQPKYQLSTNFKHMVQACPAPELQLQGQALQDMPQPFPALNDTTRCSASASPRQSKCSQLGVSQHPFDAASALAGSMVLQYNTR